MTIKDLEDLMIEHGVAIRAIPMSIRGIYDKRHADKYDGDVVYLEEYKREMLVTNRIPENAGKFIIEAKQGTMATVSFSGKKYYNSIEEAVADLLQPHTK